MKVEAFLRGNPCIEEVTGYHEQLKYDGRITPEITTLLTLRIAELKRGKVVPGGNDPKRQWIYQLGKPAVKKALPKKPAAAQPSLEDDGGDVVERVKLKVYTPKVPIR